EFLIALSNFQHANGIAITGVLDRDTMLIMTQLRCGVPDLTINPNATTTTPEPSTLSENEKKLAKMQNPNQNDTDIVQTSVLLQRIILNSRRERRQRTKRSTLFQMYSTRSGWGLAFPGRTITWRLVGELLWPSSNNQFMTSNEVWFTVKLAFRMWSEILPRNFLEDTVSPVSEVDILLGFGTNRHNRCPVPFTTQGQFIQEYAHAWPLPQAEIHFNDRQPYTRSSSNYPISLLKVAIHEIGHTLGLPHSDDRMSIMNPYYKPIQGSKDTDELRTSDRNSIQNIYGSCELPFDVAFDWVRRERAEDGVYRWKYNSYFFRRQWYWLYENRHHRPRYGDPKLTAHHWLGIMQINDQHRKIDGIVHVRELNSPEGPTFFFKGDIFLEYDNDRSRAKIRDSAGNRYPRRIKDGFPGVPYPIDTVFYKADERIIYFFKNNLVYKFHWPSKRVVDVKTVSTTFPGWGGAAPLPSNIDSAYYSYTSQAYFFFKGAYFWKMAGNQERYLNRRIRIPNNSVGPRRRTSSTWRDICDVGETELVM
uniref:Peptidase metallopeptidase domain-containing protein n=1 Tax=Ciona savignyi TaxID=51511 RepID=H2ZLQ5_CIOSA